MKGVPISELYRGGLASAVNRAKYNGERTLVMVHDKLAAVIVPLSDLETLVHLERKPQSGAAPLRVVPQP